MGTTSQMLCPHCGEDINNPVRPYRIPEGTLPAIPIPAWQSWPQVELPNREATNE